MKLKSLCPGKALEKKTCGKAVPTDAAWQVQFQALAQTPGAWQGWQILAKKKYKIAQRMVGF